MMNMVTTDDKKKDRVGLGGEIAEGDLHVAVLGERMQDDSEDEACALAYP